MAPGMSVAARLTRKEACSYDATLPKIAACLHALAEDLPALHMANRPT